MGANSRLGTRRAWLIVGRWPRGDVAHSPERLTGSVDGRPCGSLDGLGLQLLLLLLLPPLLLRSLPVLPVFVHIGGERVAMAVGDDGEGDAAIGLGCRSGLDGLRALPSKVSDGPLLVRPDWTAPAPLPNGEPAGARPLSTIIGDGRATAKRGEMAPAAVEVDVLAPQAAEAVRGNTTPTFAVAPERSPPSRRGDNDRLAACADNGAESKSDRASVLHSVLLSFELLLPSASNDAEWASGDVAPMSPGRRLERRSSTDCAELDSAAPLLPRSGARADASSGVVGCTM